MAIVTLKKKSIFQLYDVCLMPGVNKVEEDALERLLSHPFVKNMVKRKEIVIEKKSIKAKSEKEALEIIQEVTAPRILYEFLEDETRKKVIAAINKKIDSFRPKQEQIISDDE